MSTNALCWLLGVAECRAEAWMVSNSKRTNYGKVSPSLYVVDWSAPRRAWP
jgi:hypothetical protein